MMRMRSTPGAAQTRAGHQAAEAAADDQHVDLVVERGAGEAGLDIGIVDDSVRNHP